VLSVLVIAGGSSSSSSATLVDNPLTSTKDSTADSGGPPAPLVQPGRDGTAAGTGATSTGHPFASAAAGERPGWIAAPAAAAAAAYGCPAGAARAVCCLGVSRAGPTHRLPAAAANPAGLGNLHDDGCRQRLWDAKGQSGQCLPQWRDHRRTLGWF